jgi:hypothetical protein
MRVAIGLAVIGILTTGAGRAAIVDHPPHLRASP